jgi:hypothetical protein
MHEETEAGAISALPPLVLLDALSLLSAGSRLRDH